MKRALLALLLSSLNAGRSPPLEVDPPCVSLRGPDAEIQLVVTENDADVTTAPDTRYESLDPAVAVVDPRGHVRGIGDGTTRLRVRSPRGIETFISVGKQSQESSLVQFTSEIVPIFTKLGCNAGSCHGRTSGQNGFRLSLLGFEPALDFESLTREARGRRVFPAAPSESLLLKKPTALIPHGGGRRLEVDSPEFRTLARWITQGTPYDPTNERTLIELEARPVARVVTAGGTQQIRAVARFSDGFQRDVTRLADYRSTDPDLLSVDTEGHARTRDGVGEAAVVARFGGRVATSRITVARANANVVINPPSVTNLVDRLVNSELAALRLTPSPQCDDATFARRSSLDVRGILPDPAELVEFENDNSPEKRAKWVDRLCARPEYADRQATLWSALLRNQRTLGELSKPGTFAFFDWLREAFAENRPYDLLVGELLTATGDSAENPPVVWYRQGITPEEKADDVAQLFLGVRLQCARCHHHPLERWSPDDYKGFAAFFRRIGRKPGPDPVTPRVFVLPTDDAPGPRWLGEARPVALRPEGDPRAALLKWLRARDNPYFARALVNRTWKRFLGRGLVEPEDDLRASNPPTVPALLDALAEDFVAHRFDLKHLTRLILTSQTYGRSSVPFHGNEVDRLGLARFAPRRLSAEVLLDAIDQVCEAVTPFDGLPRGTRAGQLPDEGFDTPGRFLATFGRPKRETVCECERSAAPSLSQSLHLLNSAEIQRKLSSPTGRAARWLADPRPDTARVVELYRVALARRPNPEELADCHAYLERKRAQGRLREGYEDLIWTVINLKEFSFVQ